MFLWCSSHSFGIHGAVLHWDRGTALRASAGATLGWQVGNFTFLQASPPHLRWNWPILRCIALKDEGLSWTVWHCLTREDRILLITAAVSDVCDVFKLINDGYVADILPCKGYGLGISWVWTWQRRLKESNNFQRWPCNWSWGTVVQEQILEGQAEHYKAVENIGTHGKHLDSRSNIDMNLHAH